MSTFKITLTVLFFFCVPVRDAKVPSPDDIAVRIALPREIVCSDAKSLTLERFITNVGSREISISRDWVLKTREYTVVFDMKERFARVDSLQTHADSISPVNLAGRTSIKLSAGSAKRYKTEIELDEDFFQKPGFYKMRMHYSGAIREQGGTFRRVHISSNWVLFEVRLCGSKPAQ